MLVDDIKKRIPQAMKDKKVVERDILRVALSEIQNHENRSGKPPTEEEASKIIRKVIKSNEETLLVATSEETKAKLLEENQVLNGLLPQTWDVAKILAALEPVAAQIKEAKGDGPATGVAMKLLKSLGAPVEGKDVGEAVKKLRS